MWTKLIDNLQWTKLIDNLQELLLKLGAEEKNNPGSVSASRASAYAFVLTVVVATIIMAVTGQTDHLLVAQVIGGALVALGLRSKVKPPS